MILHEKIVYLQPNEKETQSKESSFIMLKESILMDLVNTAMVIILLKITFGVNNISWSHTNNRKNGVLVIGEGPADDISGSVITGEKKIVLTLLKQIATFLEFTL